MNTALVMLTASRSAGLAGLRYCLQQIQKLEVLDMSSIYRKLDPTTENPTSLEIVVVLRVQTKLDLNLLRQLFREVAADNWDAQCLLLTFNAVVDLDPESPIPHPDLHLDFLILRCAAEVQATFRHPVLGRSLEELVKSTQIINGNVGYEFLSLGEALLTQTPEAP